MNNLSKTKEELIKEFQELQHAHNSLKASYKKDIAEHKQAVEALSLFRELIDKSNDTFEVIDSETGEFLDVNARGCIDLGYSREELLSMNIFDIDPTLNLTLFQKAVEELHKSGALTWEGFHRRKDGSMFPVEVNIKSVQLDRDYIVTVVRDITTRKQAEAELLESQEKYSDLYETAPVGIYRTKIDGSKILEINNTLCEMLGFTKEEFLSQPSAIRWADPIRRNEILKILKEHGVATNFDADILKKDGSRISCLLSMKIFKDEGYIEGFILDITDRKHAEDAVRQSRKEMDTLFEASPELISFIGFDGYFKRLNPAWVKTLGYPMDKLLSIPFIEFVHPDDREASNAEAAKLAGGQRTIQFENRNRCNDGSYRWLAWSVIPDTTEKLLYAVGRDITERKISEDKLRFQSEIMNNMTEAVYLIRMKDDVIVYTNSQFEEMFGYSQNEMLGKNVSIVNAPTENDPETTVREIMRVLAEKGVWEGEVKNIRKDETTFWCYAKVSVFEHSQFGRVLISVHRDITERRQMEQVLRDAELKFKTIFDKASDGILLAETGSKTFFLANNKICEMLGYTQKEILKLGLSEIHPKKDLSYAIEQFERCLRNEISLAADIPVVRKDGTVFYADINASSLKLEGKNYLIGIFRDITERKQAEELLKITLENLERSNKELEQFAYVASHDLQEPLRMVSSFTQLLERRYKDKLDQDANDFIQYAVDGANRMQKLINDLLDYSRITSRGKDFAKVDISQVLGQTISNLQQLIIENTAMITNEDLPELKADESQILRVFQNLIENALKFKKKSELPKIHISCIKKNDFYEFAVSDNGIGMDMQFHDRVFTIFQRLHSKEDYPGTGIGLSICKRIVERHGGKIWFESKENEGTTFYFTLKE
jgi:PAS domain S-box-containing protein